MAKDKIAKAFLAITKDKFTIDTIAEMIATKHLAEGDIVRLNGYYSAGDGANHIRIISKTNDGSGVQLANGLWANIVHNGEVNVSWFGAKGDGVADDTVSIQKALDSANVVNFDFGNYIVNRLDSEDLNILNIKHNTTVKGNYSTISVGDKNNQYFSLISCVIADVEISFFDMNFFANGEKNPQTPYQGEDRFTDLPHWRHNCMWLFTGSLHLDNCTFDDFYGTQVVMFWQNSNNKKNSNAIVTNCRFLNVGSEYGVGIHDHSSLYVHKDASKMKNETLNIFIDNNIFKAKFIGAPNAVNAMEFGGETCYFTNNVIDGYITGCMSAPLLEKCKCNFIGNTITNVTTGIMPWSNKHNYYAVPSTYSNPKYEILKIEDNYITLQPNIFKNVQSYVSKSPVDGIFKYMYGGIRFYQVATHFIKSVSINNNTIEYDVTNGINSNVFLAGVADGIRMVGSSLDFHCESISIFGNTLKNIPKIPIMLGANYIKRSDITNNILLSVCLVDRGQVFFINLNHASIRCDINIKGNTVNKGDYSTVYYFNNTNVATQTQNSNLYISNTIEHNAESDITSYLYMNLKTSSCVINDVVSSLLKPQHLSYRNAYVNSSNARVDIKLLNCTVENGKLIFTNIEYPTTDDGITYNKGDIIYNKYPSDNGFFAWVCIINGKPGTWRGVYKIASPTLQLDTPYHATKMQQEGVYEDFIQYMDEKLEYDKLQREQPEGVMLLPVIEEPQPSEKLLAFKEKYLG